MLLLLVDCSLRLFNYKQAQNVLEDIDKIVQEADYIDVICLVGMHIRKARLEMALGNLEDTTKNCQDALGLLSQHQIDCREYAEIFEIMGTLQLEMGALHKSKIYFERALKAVMRHEATDSSKI